MVEIYDQHEQGEIVKKWLKENGSAMVIGLLVAFGGLFGFKQWSAWQLAQKHGASTEFIVMSELLNEEQLDAAMANYQALKDDYSGSPYATLAALQMARARVEVGQFDLAIKLYRDVVDSGTPMALSVIARGRLARLLNDQGEPDEALEMLDGAQDITGFEARYAEIRGDIYYARGEIENAITAYQLALDTLEAGVGDKTTLALKLESISATKAQDAEAANPESMGEAGVESGVASGGESEPS